MIFGAVPEALPVTVKALTVAFAPTTAPVSHLVPFREKKLPVSSVMLSDKPATFVSTGASLLPVNFTTTEK